LSRLTNAVRVPTQLMDHERVLEQIVGWAADADNFRAVVLTGSAARGPEHVHTLTDLDVELYVAQPSMLLEDDAWYAQCGRCSSSNRCRIPVGIRRGW
jgi:hypothetical protein